MKNNDIDQHREMSTDDISRYEFSKGINSSQTRFDSHKHCTETPEITNKYDGYKIIIQT